MCRQWPWKDEPVTRHLTVLTIRPVRRVAANEEDAQIPFTRYNRLSPQPAVLCKQTTGLTTVLNEQPLFFQTVFEPQNP